MRLFIFIFAMLISISGSTQIKCASQIVESIYNKLPEACKKEMLMKYNASPTTDFQSYCNTASNGTYHIVNSCNGITSIGINCFKDSVKAYYPKEIYLFLERLLLEANVNDASVFSSFIDENKISINNNYLNATAASNFTKNCLSFINPKTDFGISFDGLKYQAIWKTDSKKTSIRFPAKYSLISGMDKKEADETLFCSLTDFAKNTKNIVANIEAPPKENLKKYFQGLYILPGNTYFQKLTSDLYYVKSEDTTKYKLLYDNMFVAESFTNMLLKPEVTGKKITMVLQHKQYGKVTTASLDYLSLIQFFATNAYEAFVGIEKNENNSLTASIIFFNKYLNNLNLIYIETKSSDLFLSDIRLTASLYSNIPTDNIKNLFADYKESEKKYDVNLQKK